MVFWCCWINIEGDAIWEMIVLAEDAENPNELNQISHIKQTSWIDCTWISLYKEQNSLEIWHSCCWWIDNGCTLINIGIEGAMINGCRHWGHRVTYPAGKCLVFVGFVLNLLNHYPPDKCWANFKLVQHFVHTLPGRFLAISKSCPNCLFTFPHFSWTYFSFVAFSTYSHFLLIWIYWIIGIIIWVGSSQWVEIMVVVGPPVKWNSSGIWIWMVRRVVTIQPDLGG